MKSGTRGAAYASPSEVRSAERMAKSGSESAAELAGRDD